MSPILKLDRDDPDRELEFELAYQRTLTTKQRFDMMFRGSRQMNQLLASHERRPGRTALRDDSLESPDLGLLALVTSTLPAGGKSA